MTLGDSLLYKILLVSNDTRASLETASTIKRSTDTLNEGMRENLTSQERITHTSQRILDQSKQIYDHAVQDLQQGSENDARQLSATMKSIWVASSYILYGANNPTSDSIWRLEHIRNLISHELTLLCKELNNPILFKDSSILAIWNRSLSELVCINTNVSGYNSFTLQTTANALQKVLIDFKRGIDTLYMNRYTKLREDLKKQGSTADPVYKEPF